MYELTESDGDIISRSMARKILDGRKVALSRGKTYRQPSGLHLYRQTIDEIWRTPVTDEEKELSARMHSHGIRTD